MFFYLSVIRKEKNQKERLPTEPPELIFVRFLLSRRNSLRSNSLRLLTQKAPKILTLLRLGRFYPAGRDSLLPLRGVGSAILSRDGIAGTKLHNGERGIMSCVELP